MGYVTEIGLPAEEPVSLDFVRQRLRLPSSMTQQDTVLTVLIQGARLDAERISGLVLAQRQFSQVLDSFPYFTDTVQSQQSYPPSYYSQPRYSTTLWNYSQMIKLAKAPLISVDQLIYIGTDGNPYTLEAGTDFVVDPETKLARIFPMPDQQWPACLYTPNAVQIIFTAGYDPDPTAVTTFTIPQTPPNQQAEYNILTGIPADMQCLIAELAVWRFQNPGVPGVPADMERAIAALGILDFSPTRG